MMAVRWYPLRFLGSLLGALLIHVTLGTFYCWGNITPYVTSYLRWQGYDVQYEDTSVVFAVGGVCIGVLMYAGGRLQALLGARGASLVGAGALSLGVGASGFTVRLGLIPFVATYSVLLGSGIGLAYMAPITCLMRWLPRNNGLAAGIVVMGFGAGAFIFDPLQERLVNPSDLRPCKGDLGGLYYDWEDPEVVRHVLASVPQMFLQLSWRYAALQLLGAALLFEPPATIRAAALAEGLQQPLGEDIELVEALREYSVVEMLKTRSFWLLFINFACNTQANFFATSYTKTYAAALFTALPDSFMTRIVATASLFNGFGRIFWGLVCDRFYFRPSMLALCTAQCALVATLPLCSLPEMYMAWCCGIFMCIGGSFVLFPAATVLYFGERDVGSNYGVLFLGQSTSMLLAPQLAHGVVHNYSVEALCHVVAAFSAVGALSAALNALPAARRRKGVGA